MYVELPPTTITTGGSHPAITSFVVRYQDGGFGHFEAETANDAMVLAMTGERARASRGESSRRILTVHPAAP